MRYLNIINFVFIVLLISCSSDDTTSQSVANQAIVGNWSRTAINISAAQDVNDDGDSSTNLVDEMNCLTATLSFTDDFKWSFQGNEVNVNFITGTTYYFSCQNTISKFGTWFSSNGKIALTGDLVVELNLIDALLRQDIGVNLPGLISVEYQKN
jgi:hypothetical protein